MNVGYSLRVLTLLAGAALLAGCGFQLRRDIVLPAELQRIRVDVVDPYSPLQRNLEQALLRSGATLVSNGDAAALLRVSALSIGIAPLSIGETGRVQEFVLRYVAEVELRDASGTSVLEKQTITLARDYSFDTAQALGTPGEEEVVRQELEREMVQAILRRIEAATR